jgi:hypothetical protein
MKLDSASGAPGATDAAAARRSLPDLGWLLPC